MSKKSNRQERPEPPRWILSYSLSQTFQTLGALGDLCGSSLFLGLDF
jgi:hypothetical protein